VPLIVDNTVATPILLRPIEHGADIGRELAGRSFWAARNNVGRRDRRQGNFDWSANAGTLSGVSEPDSSYHNLIYTERFGRAAYIARCPVFYQRTTGAVLSPLSAFLLLQGIETVR